MAKRSNGEGTIYQRADGRWSGQVTGEIDPLTGKRKRITIYGKSQKEVRDKIKQLINSQDLGVNISPDRITVGQWLNDYIENYKKPKIRESTYYKYKTAVDLHTVSINHIQLKKIQTSDIQKLYNKLTEKINPKTIKIVHAVVFPALKQAVKEGTLLRNPAEYVTLPKTTKKEFQPLTREQIAKFIEINKDHRRFLIIYFTLLTGLRQGEVIPLKWEDINLKKNEITIKRSISYGKGKILIVDGKTKKALRSVPIPAPLIPLLKEHKKKQMEHKMKLRNLYNDNNFVFCRDDGEIFHPNSLHWMFKYLSKRAGIPTSTRFHDLRHTYATLLLEAGENPKVVQELLGHADIGTTLNIYSHVSFETKERAAEKLTSILEKI